MPRSIWTGSISFGLVNIPVKVFSAIREHNVRFHQLAPDGSRIHNKRVSEKTGRAVEFKDIKKGYETSKGKVVVFEHDELDKFAPATTKTIEIEDFVALEEIDPISSRGRTTSPRATRRPRTRTCSSRRSWTIASVSASAKSSCARSNTSRPSAPTGRAWPCRRCSSPTRWSPSPRSPVSRRVDRRSAVARSSSPDRSWTPSNAAGIRSGITTTTRNRYAP